MLVAQTEISVERPSMQGRASLRVFGCGRQTKELSPSLNTGQLPAHYAWHTSDSLDIRHDTPILAYG